MPNNPPSNAIIGHEGYRQQESEIDMRLGSLLPAPGYGNYCQSSSGSYAEVLS